MALLKVLLLGLGVSVNSAVSLQKRIIGGQNCDDTERLYHVRLESRQGDVKIHCGGSLIHPQWILTAAHCWQSEPGWTNEAFLKVHPRTAGQQRQMIQQPPMILTHLGRHDIMLLKLETPVTGVPLPQLPDCNNRLKIGDVVQLAGEGRTTTGPNNQRLPSGVAISSHLQCVNMNVAAVDVFEPNSGFMFGAASQNQDICYDDDGGAALHNGMIYGVISHGGPVACQKPVAIMDVCEYKKWIKGIIELQ